MSILINRQLAAKALAEGKPLSSVANRGVGKTTASILSALASAINNPGTEVIPHDPDLDSHRVAWSTRRQRANEWQRRAEAIISAMELQDITVTVDTDAVVKLRSTFAEVMG